MNDPLVSLTLQTYNHERYVREALDSILEQKHDYSCEIIIIDDFSTDDTRNILLAYKEKYPYIKLMLNEYNMGLIKTYFKVMKQCRGKYIMACSGDDYFLPGAVAVQIKFMEENPDVGLSYGKVKVWRRGHIIKEIQGFPYRGLESLFLDNYSIPAHSMVIRNKIFINYCCDIDPESKGWLMEDYPMLFYFGYKSKIGFNDSLLGVYRVHNQSMEHKRDPFVRFAHCNSAVEVMKYFYKYTNQKFDIRILEEMKYKLYLNYALLFGDKKLAQKCIKNITAHTLKYQIKRFCVYTPLFYLLYLYYWIKTR